MKPECSLPHPQNFITCSYPKPERSSPCPHSTSQRSILILSSHIRLGLPSGILSLPKSIKNRKSYPCTLRIKFFIHRPITNMVFTSQHISDSTRFVCYKHVYSTVSWTVGRQFPQNISNFTSSAFEESNRFSET